MATDFGSASSAVSANASFTVPAPTGTAANEVLVAFVYRTSNGTISLSGGTTWNVLSGGLSSTKYLLAWKYTGGSEPASYTVTLNAADSTHISIIRSPGGPNSTPVFAVNPSAGDSTSIVTPSVTPTTANDLLIRFAAGLGGGSGTTWTPPASHTERTDQQQASDATGTSATRLLASGAATGTAAFTASIGVFTAVGMTVAIAGSISASATPDPVAATTSVPAPTVSTGAGAHPAPVAVTTAVPAPSVSSGVGAHPDPVTVTASVPTPNVSTEPTELVYPDPVTATTAVPAPAVSAGASTTLTTATATTTVPAPTVRVDADVIMGVVAVQATVPSPVVDVPILPGDKVTRAGQAEWQGFLLGSGTPYSWQELTGWRTLPPVISGSVDQPLGHGSYDGQPYLGERTVTWVTLIKAPRSQIAGAIRDLEMAVSVSPSEDPGSLVIWDLDGAEPYLVHGHATQREPGPITRQARLGLSRGVLQWVCSDPRRYSVVRYSAVIPKDAETAVLNNGNADSPEILRIPGPATTPQIENLTLDRVVGFDITVPDGHLLEIDTKHGTVVLDGDDKLSTLIEGSTSVKDFVLGPGPNTLLYTTASGGTAGLAVLWRHAIA
ncbi:hypothetical protein ACFYY8_06220 [Streptosporangium sp. NPDC001559]|uniref:hypothetical protein n=1 Tax=Streptosporangium sp. NPDC001559 TaxID=3366187 RepID=UPI0036F0AB0D